MITTGIRVLSMFDGISVGRLALERAGIKVAEYHTFEIDKIASSIARYHWPDIIEHGNIEDIDYSLFEDFDLLLCGSPCQDLSAFTKNRKGLEGDKSRLFFYGARAMELGICRNFLFENVAGMRTVDRKVMTDCIGVEPVRLCSSLVSAQSRGRLYWTNLPVQINEHRAVAQSVLEHGIAPRDTYTAILCSPDSVSSLLRKMAKHRVQQFKAIPDNQGEYLHGSMEYGKRYYNLTEGQRYRLERLLPVELERLQTLPDNYTKYGLRNGDVVEIGYHSRHHAIGNAWTADIITDILRALK